MGLWKNIKIVVRTKFRKSEYSLHGIRIPIDRDIITDRILYSIIRGRYESTESKALKAHIRSDDRVLELGGGLGLISALASKIVKSGEVVSVEANPRMVHYIAQVHALNGIQATVLNAIVAKSDTAKAAPFYLRKNFWSSSMSPQPADYVETVQVPVRGINELVQQYQPTVAIIDIEGGETELIAGNWPDQLRLIIMEVHTDVIGNDGLQRIKDFFVKAGFSANLNGAMLTMTR
jgi:FkbM family methyltransferase